MYLFKVTTYFIVLFFHLISFNSCNLNSSIDESSPVAVKDSLQIVFYFEEAIKDETRADSLIKISSNLANKQEELLDIYNLNYGRYLILSGDLANAELHINAVINSFQEDTLNYHIAKYYNLLAAISSYSKAHEQAVIYFHQAIKIYELHEDYNQSSVIKFNLANIFFARRDFESVYKYSNEAKGPLIEAGDTAMLTLCLSILSTAAANLGKLEIAEEHALKSLELNRKSDNLQGDIFSRYAMGEVKLAKGNTHAAKKYFSEAIEIGEQHHAQQWLLPVRAGLLRAHLSSSDYQAAIETGKQLEEKAKLLNNIDILYSVFKNLAYALEHVGRYEDAYFYLKNAETLFSENITEANERIIQDMLIKYETQRKNNLILSKENAIVHQRMWNIILLAGSITLIISLIWSWKNAQQKNKLFKKEKENEIFKALHIGEERERKRLANELHDGIASNLVAIKLNLENTPSPAQTEHEKILSLVSLTHQEIRKVAHNLAPIDFNVISLQQSIKDFVDSCNNAHCEVAFFCNLDKNSNILLPLDTSMIIYRAVQELVQNALKHANASFINVQLLKSDKNNYIINIEDDGTGFDSTAELPPKGGLKNLISRLQNINAEIDITSVDSGTSIFIKIKS